MSEKSRIRDLCRTGRQELSLDIRQRLDARIRERLLMAITPLDVASVGAFAAFDGEPDVLPALRRLRNEGVALALPVLAESPRAIELHRWTDDSVMSPNRFGIPEPQRERRVEPGELDLLLIPLVAFDDLGTRLGMGAGLYDRLLEPVAEHRRPLRIGVAYELQRVTRIPRDAWDVPLHAVVTEAGWFSFTHPGHDPEHPNTASRIDS